MVTITRDAIVRCEPNGNMAHPFTGKVEKVYENSALVRILEYHDKDRMNARELLYAAIISKRAMAIITPGVPVEEAEAMSDVG